MVFIYLENPKNGCKFTPEEEKKQNKKKNGY